MRRRQLEYRRLSSLSQVPLTRILNGWLGEVDFERIGPATGAIGERPIYVDDRSSQTVADIRATARRLRAEKRVDVVIVDYVQLVSGELRRKGGTRSEELADISRRLKVLADEIDCPVVVLSQLNRGADARADKRPILSDLRETGALEQDADSVCFLHRENHRESGVTNFIVEKQRNGPTGTLNLSLNRETQTFSDVGPEPEAPKQEALAEDLQRKKKPRRSRPDRW
jgi:replicative DNA helicase